MARLSYFAEKRGQNNDPNFFNRVPLDEIRKNVKRIIKDIKFDMIQDQDFNYFHNPQIIQACIAEAQENYTSCVTICNSLNFYINECMDGNGVIGLQGLLYPGQRKIDGINSVALQCIRWDNSANWDADFELFGYLLKNNSHAVFGPNV